MGIKWNFEDVIGDANIVFSIFQRDQTQGIGTKVHHSAFKRCQRCVTHKLLFTLHISSVCC